MDEFHFLRPWWLLAVPIGIGLLWRAWRAGLVPGPWETHCDRSLRSDIIRVLDSRGSVVWCAVVVGIVLASLAMAGPTWERIQAKTSHPQDARMILLDLSLSMHAEDVLPSRLEVAHRKVREILNYPYQGQFGLVVFAGAGFSVTPLTTDKRTLDAFLPVLEPSVLPLQGSRIDRGLDVVVDVLAKGGAQQGEVIVIADGSSSARSVAMASELQERGFRLSVIAVGTEAGGAVRLGRAGLLRDMGGAVVRPRLPRAELEAIARAGGGQFHMARSDADDVESILDSATVDNRQWTASDRTVSHWLDRGPWLVLVLLPLAALAFRRGAYLSVLLSLIVLPPPSAQAWELFVGADTRALRSIAAGDYTEALAVARDPLIIGVALYRLGQYGQAALAFSTSDSADAHYNRGNALAKNGDYHGAVRAYKAVLARAPFHADARMNRELVEALIEEQTEPGRRWVTGGEPTAGNGAGDGNEGGGSDGRPKPNPQNPDAPESAPEFETLESLDAFAGPVSEPDGEEAKPVHQEEMVLSDELLDEWLERIPDDPSALLRRRFEYEFDRRAWRSREGRSDSW
ncbi:MAG: VWA domain-containing protein [Pseudomonadota bacterium]